MRVLVAEDHTTIVVLDDARGKVRKLERRSRTRRRWFRRRRRAYRHSGSFQKCSRFGKRGLKESSPHF